ncbi:MAG: type II secretion system F family protein [Patescibacteria group bacterium]
MPTYLYKVKTPSGEKSGSQEAKSEQELAHSLASKGWNIVLIKESGDSKKQKEASFSFRSISLVEKMVFTKNLAVMIGAGLSLTKALNVLTEQTENKKFKQIIRSISEDIQKGDQLAVSMSKYKSAFSSLYVSMIKVGETAGNLQDVLNSLATQMKKDHDIVSRVRGALMYPAVVLIAMFGIGALMMTIVVPSLAKTFADTGISLPASTQFIIALSDFLVNFWYIAIIIIMIVVYTINASLKTESGKKFFDKLILKIPVLSNLSKKLNSARFGRIFSTLIDSGVPVVNALEILSNTLSNFYFAESVKYAAKEIQKGKSLSKILESYKDIYPPLVTQMIEVGEETGALTNIMAQLAEFYEEEVDNITKNMSTIVEPIMMIFIGVAVGFFAVSMITPMYSILDSV